MADTMYGFFVICVYHKHTYAEKTVQNDTILT